MKVSRRFQIVVRTVLFIASCDSQKDLTCEYISNEMNCNLAVTKSVLNLLYKNNFLVKNQSSCKLKLKRDIKEITLWDIYKITDEVDIKKIFIDDESSINKVDLPESLTTHFEQILKFMEETLSKVSLEALLTKQSYNEYFND